MAPVLDTALAGPAGKPHQHPTVLPNQYMGRARWLHAGAGRAGCDVGAGRAGCDVGNLAGRRRARRTSRRRRVRRTHRGGGRGRWARTSSSAGPASCAHWGRARWRRRRPRADRAAGPRRADRADGRCAPGVDLVRGSPRTGAPNHAEPQADDRGRAACLVYRRPRQ